MNDANGNTLKIWDKVNITDSNGECFTVISCQDEFGDVLLVSDLFKHEIHRHPSSLVKLTIKE